LLIIKEQANFKIGFFTFALFMIKSDTLNIINKLSIHRIVNLVKLYSSFIISRITKKGIVFGLPTALSIEPTTACNLGCPECPSGLKLFTRKTGNLKNELNNKIIDELYKKLLYINYYFQGEPFINPLIFDFIKKAHSKKIYTSTSTNAHFLTPINAQKTIESGLDRLIISIDGTSQETYELYRINGSLEKVIEGTKNIITAKKQLKSKTPHIIFQFLVVKHNEHEIENAITLSKELGVNEIRFKTAQVYDYKNGNSLIPENDKYSRYKLNNNGEYELKNKLYNHCWRMWSSSVITVDGKLAPCCFDKDAKYKIGDLKNSSFNSIWKSNAYNKFRTLILSNRKEIDICQNCTEGTKVWT
jgi:radical SAM protein with 4Fe4S-binding SPASM domain